MDQRSLSRNDPDDDEGNQQHELMAIEHRGMDYQRVVFDKKRRTEGEPGSKSETPTLEESFAYEWEKWNVASPETWATGILQKLMFAREASRHHDRCREVITQRDARIVASIIQWLGTNVGRSFLHDATKAAGYYLLSPHEVGAWNRRAEQIKQLLRERSVAEVALAKMRDELRTMEESRNSFSRLAMERQRMTERVEQELTNVRSRIDTYADNERELTTTIQALRRDLHAMNARVNELEAELAYEEPAPPIATYEEPLPPIAAREGVVSHVERVPQDHAMQITMIDGSTITLRNPEDLNLRAGDFVTFDRGGEARVQRLPQAERRPYRTEVQTDARGRVLRTTYDQFGDIFSRTITLRGG
jgi:signal transduction histidine kinase